MNNCDVMLRHFQNRSEQRSSTLNNNNRRKLIVEDAGISIFFHHQQSQQTEVHWSNNFPFHSWFTIVTITDRYYILNDQALSLEFFFFKKASWEMYDVRQVEGQQITPGMGWISQTIIMIQYCF